ncbi:MAG: hypothetical protein JW709_08075 [Sedimentisphaerales bacterium]|nr:hypothetical protein [Sedimentisphaerales bacterium]
MKQTIIFSLGLAFIALLLGGCAANNASMQQQFDAIIVGQTDSTEVLNTLDNKGLLQTTTSVSVAHNPRWGGEVGIVQFSETDATVRRRIYFAHRSSQQAPLATRETTHLAMVSLIPDDILNEPYETNRHLYRAVLGYLQEALISDAQPFTEDQNTESLIGLARAGLQTALIELDHRPRAVDDVTTEKGFTYMHPLMGRSVLFLRPDPDNHAIYALTIDTGAWADPLTGW